MKRTVIFVLIVTLVSGAASFLLAALGAPSGQGPPPFVGVALGMVAGIVFLLLFGSRKVPIADAEARRRALETSLPTAPRPCWSYDRRCSASMWRSTAPC